jgi:hypothetical protein
MRYLALLAAIVALSACSEAREWKLHGESAQLGGAAVLTYKLLKQQDDYVRVVFTIHNTSSRTLRFAPITAATAAWGLNLRAEDGALLRRASPFFESALALPADATGEYEGFWIRDPMASDQHWKWRLTVDGLMAGDDLVPQVVLEPPPWVDPRGSR